MHVLQHCALVPCWVPLCSEGLQGASRGFEGPRGGPEGFKGPRGGSKGFEGPGRSTRDPCVLLFPPPSECISCAFVLGSAFGSTWFQACEAWDAAALRLGSGVFHGALDAVCAPLVSRFRLSSTWIPQREAGEFAPCLLAGTGFSLLWRRRVTKYCIREAICRTRRPSILPWFSLGRRASVFRGRICGRARYGLFQRADNMNASVAMSAQQ